PPPPPVPPVADADALSQAVADALKDYPTVKGTVTDQVLKLTGEIKRDRLQTLMMSLNALKSAGLKSIDSKDLIKK
ncbi:MAG TPA: BON domain-containing protein, partial [Chitinophagaceae bacterium]|nr:BON domain-containing protein [Chitinophagaceae bacterium]